MTRQAGAILIVDDNAENRDVLRHLLERQGYAVQAVESGARALELAASGSCDLLLLDIVMPGMDGYEVLRRFKASAALKPIPVIVISAVDEIGSVVRCIELGAEDYLTKPFDPVLLRARITACLEKKRLRDQELRYLRQVALLTHAAQAVEAETFEPDSLSELAARPDSLGTLARVFIHMAHDVYEREMRLRGEAHSMPIVVDEASAAEIAAGIIATDFFQSLRTRTRRLNA